jgi:hypothetical protein
VIWGIGDGFSYFANLISAWSWLPNHKGRATGAVFCAFGLGSAIFNAVLTKVVNPDNLHPDIIYQDGNVEEHYYSEEVAERVPLMLKVLAGMCLTFGLIAACFTQPIKKTALAAASSAGSKTLKEIYRESTVYKLLFLMTLICSSGVYILVAYKTYGAIDIDDDLLLSLMGSVGAITNSIGRIIWAQVTD